MNTLYIELDRLNDENKTLKYIIKQILNDLPQNKDWLNPDIEKMARIIIIEDEFQKSMSVGSASWGHGLIMKEYDELTSTPEEQRFFEEGCLERLDLLTKSDHIREIINDVYNKEK